VDAADGLAGRPGHGPVDVALSHVCGPLGVTKERPGRVAGSARNLIDTLSERAAAMLASFTETCQRQASNPLPAERRRVLCNWIRDIHQFGRMTLDSNMLRAHSILVLSALAVVCVLVEYSAPTTGERDDATPQDLLAAVRAADTDRVQQLLRHGADVNSRTEDGTTALMHATAVGDIKLVRMLLEHKADVNAKNRAGATALLWAVGDGEKVRALLDRGADVNARADSGRTPLMVAAGSPGAAGVVQLLMEKGADARYGHQGFTVLMAAAESGDGARVRLLLENGADAKPGNLVGWTALHAAAVAGDQDGAEALLAHGADVNARESLQGRTPLLWAAAGGRTDVVKLFLDRGGDAKAKETFHGATTLISAAASERGDLGLVNLLLDKGAEPVAKDDSGDSAVDWARRRGSHKVVQALEQKGARGRANDEPQEPLRRMGDDNTVAKAVGAALPLLQRSSETFFAKSGQGCVSCHHQALPALALQFVRERGFKVNEEKARRQAQTTRRLLAGRRERLLQGTGVADQLDAGYWLLALAAGGAARDDTTDALVHYLTLKQATDGRWRATLFRPPSNDGDFTATALAVHGLQLFGPPGRGAEIAGRVAKARAWLVSATPRTTEDRTFQLLGLKWAGARKEDIDKAAARLLAEQGQDGGWSQLSSMAADAYATGQVLVALQQVGAVSVADAACRRGRQFLLKTQLGDGSWFVQSRSLPVQPYFETGFPHGRSQFISCAATSWAAAALGLNAAPAKE
jgi:ankyrin repeat protein